MIQYVAPLMHLTALDPCRLAGMAPHRHRQRLAAIQNIQARSAEIKTPRGQIVE